MFVLCVKSVVARVKKKLYKRPLVISIAHATSQPKVSFETITPAIVLGEIAEPCSTGSTQ